MSMRISMRKKKGYDPVEKDAAERRLVMIRAIDTMYALWLRAPHKTILDLLLDVTAGGNMKDRTDKGLIEAMLIESKRLDELTPLTK